MPQLLDHLREFIGPTPSFDPGKSDREFVLAAYDNPAIMLGPDIVPALKRASPHIRITFVVPDPETITQASIVEISIWSSAYPDRRMGD